MHSGGKLTLEETWTQAAGACTIWTSINDVIETSRDGNHVNGAHYTLIAGRRQVAIFTVRANTARVNRFQILRSLLCAFACLFVKADRREVALILLEFFSGDDNATPG